MMSQKPEILAPAGGWPQLKAAVHAGADAVYFGLKSGLNARVRADSFAAEELTQVMDYLHERGCKGYLTLNTLVFDEELAQLEMLVRAAALAGVDALIVQDIGALILARQCAPNLPLHGSTQMSITDQHGVAFAQALGVERVVLGRELSIDELKTIDGETSLELEAFVHGALCVSYSGQCYSSEAWGGRSANRGQCAQACRLPYGLLVDGELRELGDQNYLLSPQDLMGLEQLPRLIDAGLSCLKIEGRLKGPEYVLTTVQAYRHALDQAWTQYQQTQTTQDLTLPKAQRRQLAQVFSRGQNADHDGLTPGFLEGPQHQKLVIGRNPRHRGLYLGTVQQITEQGVILTLHNPLKAGDGVVFDSGKPQQREPGGNVFHLLQHGQRVQGEIDSGQVELTFGPHFNARGIQVGDIVWRSKDTRMDAGSTLDRHNAAQRIAVQFEIVLHIDQAVQMCVRSGAQQVQLQGQKVQTAQARPVDQAALHKAIGQLGDTPFTLESLRCTIDDQAFIPMSEIKRLRRQALTELQQGLRQHARQQRMPEAPVLPGLLPETTAPCPIEQTQLSLLCRNRDQVDAALALDQPPELILDFLEVHGLKAACEAVRAAGRRLIIAAPRIFKPGEHRLVRYLCHLRPDALLVRSPGLLWQLHQRGGEGAAFDEEVSIPTLWGDFSLNAANALSAQHLLDMGLSQLALTHDLNAQQIAALARALAPEQRAKLALIAHQHLPIFHTEHCVFARFMSQGNSYRDCGRPCEHHQVHLRDPGGADHLLQADIGCRNTLFNAQAQSAAPFIKDLRNSGIAHYRIELVDEPAEQVATLVDGYRALLNQQLDHQSLWKTLRHIPDANQQAQGVGAGSLAIRVEAPRGQMKKPTAR